MRYGHLLLIDYVSVVKESILSSLTTLNAISLFYLVDWEPGY